MSSSYVCQTCRRELKRRIQARRLAQWPARRGFISFNEIVPPKKEQESAIAEGSSSEQRPFRRLNEMKQQNDVNDDVEEKESAVGRYSRFGREVVPPPSQKDFQINTENLRSLRSATQARSIDTLSPSEAAALVPPSTQDEREFDAPLPVSRTARPIEDENGPAVQLWEILSKKEVDAKEAWDFFREHYVEPGKENAALKRPSMKDRAIIRDKKLFRQLLRAVATQWKPGDESVPPPGELVKVMHEYGIMGQGWYLLEILEMLYRLLRVQHGTEKEENMKAKVAVEEQLLLLWSQSFRNCPSKWVADGRQLKQDMVEGQSVDWTGLPDAEHLNFSKRMGGDAYRFPFRIHRMFSGVPTASIQHLAVAALLTFDYFTAQYCRPYVTPNDRIPYEPFLKLILKTLHGAQDTDIVSSLGISLLQDNDVPAEEIAKITPRLSQIQHRAALATAIDDLQVLGSETLALTSEQENKLIAYFHGRIKRQIERQNRGVIDQLWQQALLAYGSSEPDSANLIPPKIYSAFLFGYRDLEEPERQTEVWNHMLAKGMTPTHEQWGLMISARMKHLNSMEHIWERMNASGTKPDRHTWCTRISGHIYYGNPEEGMQMLYQWGNGWYAEISSMFNANGVEVPEVSRLTRDGPTIPRPNTDVLTTVITALVQRGSGRKRRLDLVPDAFAWAATFGVVPSLWTYNTLFRTCLKDGNLKEAMQILSKMSEDKIAPDAYTFYAFADFVFKAASRSSMGREEQFRLMFNILDLLEQRGLKPEKVVFGSMIDSLLKVGNREGREPNLQAAMMLLRVMMEKKVTVSSAIWTSLMTHHFQTARTTGTLDFAAIDALWRKMNETTLGLDAMFYDRMIEGYASFGEIGRAVAMLERMGKEGKRPSWQALSALLQAYLKQNLTDAATGLVRDAASSSGLLRDGVRSAREGTRNPAREGFFALASEAGLLQEGELDKRAVSEYEVSALSEGMGIPMGVGEGYGKHSHSFAEGAEEEVESGAAGFQDLEKEFGKSVELMPGWDEVVDRSSARSRR